MLSIENSVEDLIEMRGLLVSYKEEGNGASKLGFCIKRVTNHWNNLPRLWWIHYHWETLSQCLPEFECHNWR